MNSQIKIDQQFQVGVRLVGKAIELFPYIAYSFLEIGKEGLGKDRIPFRIETISQPAVSNIVYEHSSTSLGSLKTEPIKRLCPMSGKPLTVEFLTPAKLQVGGKLTDKISFSNLIHAAWRRISILDYFYGQTAQKIPSFSLIYTHVLNCGPSCGRRLVEAFERCFMRIHLTCRAKWTDRRKCSESPSFKLTFVATSEGILYSRKWKIPLLCGLI